VARRAHPQQRWPLNVVHKITTQLHNNWRDAKRSVVASRRCDLSPERFVFCQPQCVGRSPEFACPGRSDESRWWEVDLEHASSRETAGHYLQLCSRSEEFGLLGHHQRVWQHDLLRTIDEAEKRSERRRTSSDKSTIHLIAAAEHHS